MPDAQTIKNARRSRLSAQTRLLRAVDERGHALFNDDGEYYLDLDRAPLVLQDIGVPPALAEARFDTSEFTKVEEVRQWYLDTFNSEITDQNVDRLVLFVDAGSNYIAAASLWNAVQWGRTVAWYTWHDFVSRYTASIDRSRVLSSGNAEEMAMAAAETEDASDEDFKLRYVYDVLVITDFDIHALRDFAVPDITSMFRNRPDWGLVTIITAADPHSAGLTERNPDALGQRGALLRQFTQEARVFDGGQ